MTLFNWKNPIDKAVDIVGDVAEKGMSMWDSSKFTPQEQAGFFAKLLEATKSQATSISRRHLLYFVLALTTLSFSIAVYYNETGQTEKLTGLKEIVETWKIGYAFVAAVSFYYFAHFTGGKK